MTPPDAMTSDKRSEVIEPLTDADRLNTVLNAITYTLEEVNDIEWLRVWVEGDEWAMRELEEWEKSR